jgi:hypothetical protein
LGFVVHVPSSVRLLSASVCSFHPSSPAKPGDLQERFVFLLLLSKPIVRLPPTPFLGLSGSRAAKPAILSALSCGCRAYLIIISEKLTKINHKILEF